MSAPQKDGEKEYWLDKKANVDLIWKLVVATCALLFAADFFYHKHVYFDFEHWYGFYGVYGFFGCVALVLAAKQMRKVLKRDEDYYDR